MCIGCNLYGMVHHFVDLLSICAPFSSTGLVPEQKNQMAEETRGRDGHGQEEARL